MSGITKVDFVGVHGGPPDAQPTGQVTADAGGCNLGEGDLPLRNTLNRLRGIGFDGYLLIGSTQQLNLDPTQLEQSLTAARTVLQQWQILPMPVAG